MKYSIIFHMPFIIPHILFTGYINRCTIFKMFVFYQIMRQYDIIRMSSF